MLIPRVAQRLNEFNRKLAKVIRAIAALAATACALTLLIAFEEASNLTVIALACGLIGSLALMVSMTVALRKTGVSEDGGRGA